MEWIIKILSLLIVSCSSWLVAAPVAVIPIVADISSVKPGPITVTTSADSLQVSWADNSKHTWQATFSLDAAKPLIASINADGKAVVLGARPVYRGATGKRKGGWDAFFDDPAADHDGTRRFQQEFHPAKAVGRSVGNRVEVSFDGMRLGIFEGTLTYVFYPGSALVQQIALLSTKDRDTAYYYDAGLQMTADADRTPGLNMGTSVAYYDANDKLQQVTSPYGSERHTLQVRYRAVAVKSGAGSIVAFPSPHRYLFARDYSTNMGYSWYSAWRGQVGVGIQQYPEDNTTIYPWINAPPATKQEMGIFFLLSADAPAKALDAVTTYTHKDRFEHLDGFVAFAPHWHLAFTEQQVANGPRWVPPFKPVLEKMGVDSAMIMDFHIDGHPSNLSELRLREIDQYYKACREQTDSKFLLIPAEEADVILGGHWGLVFPKPVFWFMDRKEGEPFKSVDPTYGTVYRVHSTDEIWKMIIDEKGFAYQTHPRTKGSTGYPDKIMNTVYFKAASYIGTGWKAMPADLSSPRLGERGFKVLDDLNNLGMHKVTMGEIDLFQTFETDELYAHMNINYLRLKQLPDFDHYGKVLDAAASADGFVSTGEVTLPSASVHAGSRDAIEVKADVVSTFPLRIAEVVWGDGKQTHHEIIDLQSSPEFDRHSYTWKANAPGWTWARIAVWDVAGGGAFTNPVWR
jgi:hypothetical protein